MSDSSFWLCAQALGMLSMLFGWWANAQRCDKQLVYGNFFAALLTATHFLLLGSALGFTNQLLSAARFALARRERTYLLCCLLCLVALLQGLLLANHWAEWCAVTAAMLSTIAVFHCRGFKLRTGLLVANGLNLTLSVYLMSASGVLYQGVTIALLCRQLWQGDDQWQTETG